MLGVLAAVGAELVHRHPVGIVATVLAGDVVTVPAFLARQSDLRSEFGGCHGGAFRFMTDLRVLWMMLWM